MDKISLVKNLRMMSNKIIEDHKTVSLIMLLGNNVEEKTTSYDYVISATWLNNYNHEDGMDIVLDYLYENLQVEDLKHISRVTLIHTNDFIVQSITRNVGLKWASVVFNECQFGNVIIPHTIIFESRREI